MYRVTPYSVSCLQDKKRGPRWSGWPGTLKIEVIKSEVSGGVVHDIIVIYSNYVSMSSLTLFFIGVKIDVKLFLF